MGQAQKRINFTMSRMTSQWIWLNTIDKVFFGTTKADGVPGGMDNGEDVGVEKQILAQEENTIQYDREEEPDYPRTRVSNLSRL